MGGGGGGRRAAPGGGTRPLPGGILSVVERLLHLADGLVIAAQVAGAQGGLRGGVVLLGLAQVLADERAGPRARAGGHALAGARQAGEHPRQRALQRESVPALAV